MPFPESRFRRARLSADVIDEQRALYERLGPVEQAGYDAQFATMADDAIAERFTAEQDREATPEEDARNRAIQEEAIAEGLLKPPDESDEE